MIVNKKTKDSLSFGGLYGKLIKRLSEYYFEDCISCFEE